MDDESLQTCYICRDDFGVQFQSELIGEKNKICSFCISDIKKIRTQINSMVNRKIKLYGKNIQVIIDPTQIFEILKYLQCRICFRFTICCKSCINEHYFCINCFDEFFSGQINLRKIQCPQQNCDQEVSHYIITMFMKKGQFQKWNALRYNLFCPRKDCQDTIRIPPFGNLETQIFKIDNEQSKCFTCQIKICNICWTEFKGNYHQHYNKCNSENFRNELFKNYFLEQDIAQCPKCKYYSSYDCRIRNQLVQQCQICGTKFCIFCKTANLELFFMQKPFHYACNCYENFCNRTDFKQFIGFFLLLLTSPIWLIILAGCFLTDYVKLKVSKINFPYKQVCYYIFFPLILIFWAIYYFFQISLEISYRIFVFYHVMLGIWEDWNNYLKIFDDK